MRGLLAGAVLLTISGRSSCGGGTSDGTSGGNASLPPSGLTYSVNPAVYTVGITITANTPA